MFSAYDGPVAATRTNDRSTARPRQLYCSVCRRCALLDVAAVCPHPPLLVPSLGVGPAPELDRLRKDCRDAVAAVADARPDVTYVVGVDSAPRARSWLPWGVDEAVDVPEPMPLALLVGAWLTTGSVRSFVVVDDDMDPADCAALGRELAASAARVGLVVMGDGSARRSEKAPGYLDDRAAGYDDAVAKAFASADVATLLQLDPGIARDLMVAGRASWQVLAGAAADRPAPHVRAAAGAAPYGVGYHVVTWSWQDDALLR